MPENVKPMPPPDWFAVDVGAPNVIPMVGLETAADEVVVGVEVFPNTKLPKDDDVLETVVVEAVAGTGLAELPSVTNLNPPPAPNPKVIAGGLAASSLAATSFS